MFQTIKPLILASGSPRRETLLSTLGITFTVVVPEVDESLLSGEMEETYTLRMAQSKGEEVSKNNPSAWVVSADTIVVIEDRLLTKPANAEQAIEMLLLLSGREHQVRTGFCLCCLDQGVSLVRSILSRVRFKDFDIDLAKAYVRTGEPLDKAGSYGIQGRGGVLVESISGSYSNVVGLPLAEVVDLLAENRVIVPAGENHPDGSSENKG
ncbi:MAG: Maf family protein [Desulfocapsaceae bacterium]